MVNPDSPAKTNAIEVGEDAEAEVNEVENQVMMALNASNPDAGIMTVAGTPSLALSVSNSDKVIETVQGGSTAYSDHLVTITGQELDNYTLSMSSASSNLTKPSDTSGVDITGAGGVTGNSMGANKWGYAVAEEGTSNSNYGGLTYSTVPTNPTTIASGNAATNGTLSAKKKIVIAARFGEDAASGTYRHSINLSAVATATMVTYTINFNANGGSNAPTVTAQNSNEDSVSFTLPKQGGMSRTGYSFLGWSTSSTATTASYAPGSSYTVNRSNPNPTLYAVWRMASFNTNITTMQQMTPAICAAADIGATTVLTDNRSGYASGTMTSPGGITHNMNQYVVIKMLDGTCWMAENLRIINTSISSSNSDMTSGSFTIPASDKTSKFNSSDQYERRAYYEDATYGAYYNWFTATAGAGTSNVTSGDVNTSICPKGWKLPAYSGTGSFINLKNKYISSWTTVGGKNGYKMGYNSDSAFWSAAGYTYNGYLSFAGSFGYYWSRGAYNSSKAYYLHFYSSEVNPQYNFERYLGLSVRCVAAS